MLLVCPKSRPAVRSSAAGDPDSPYFDVFLSNKMKWKGAVGVPMAVIMAHVLPILAEAFATAPPQAAGACRLPATCLRRADRVPTVDSVRAGLGNMLARDVAPSLNRLDAQVCLQVRGRGTARRVKQWLEPMTDVEMLHDVPAYSSTRLREESGADAEVRLLLVRFRAESSAAAFEQNRRHDSTPYKYKLGERMQGGSTCRIRTFSQMLSDRRTEGVG